MKKTFKFMAMALAAVVMAGATVSCDPMDKDDDQKEQTDGDQTGDENEDNVAFPTPEGKQWVYADPSFGGSMGYFYDFGATEPNVIYEGYLMLENNSPMSPAPASYMIQPTDETSGVIYLIGGAYYGDGVEYAYRNLTETTVEIEATLYDMMAEAGTFITLTLASQPIIIEIEPAQ